MSIMFLYFDTNAQDTVRIGVTGLTCSSCSKSVEEEMRKISFVQSIFMNLNSNEATVIIDDSQPVDWMKLAKSVYNAGFSIGYFYVPACGSSNVYFGQMSCGDVYHYIGSQQVLHPQEYYVLVGKFFMDKKTFGKWEKQLKYLPKAMTNVPIYYYY